MFVFFLYLFGSEIWNLALTFKTGNFLHCVAFCAVFWVIFCIFETTSGFSLLLPFQKFDSNNKVCIDFPTRLNDSGLSTSVMANGAWC